MDHLKILKRAWTVTWRHRALWLFGFLFALAGGGSRLGGGPPSGRGPSGQGPGGGGPGGGGPPPLPYTLPNIPWDTVLIVASIVVAIALLLVVIMTIVRYVAETAMIAGVDEIEGTGEKLTVRHGFRLGWSRQALRLFLTNLVITVLLAAVAIVLLALAASPSLLWLTHVEALGIAGTIITVGLVLPLILFIIATALAVSVVMPYIQRRVVLGKQGVRASIRQGLTLVRATLLDTGLMWLLLIGVRIVEAVAMIPVMIILAALAIAIGAVPAGLVFLFSHAWIATILVGVALFLIAFIPPMTFVRGLFEVYVSTTWTLAYREVMARYNDLLPVNGN